MKYSRNIYERRGRWYRRLQSQEAQTHAIHIARDGVIWLCGQGLWCHDGGRSFDLLSRLGVSVSLCMSGFSADDQWWGLTKDGRLFSVDLQSHTLKDQTSLLPDLSDAYWIWASTCSSDVLVGLPNKLIRFDKKQCSVIDVPGGPEGMLQHATISPKGEIWYTTSSGVHRYDGEKTHTVNVDGLGVTSKLWEIIVARDDVAWVASNEDGVFKVDSSMSLIGKVDSGLVNYTPAMPLFEDHAGNMWLRYRAHSISCVTPEGSVHFTAEDGIASPNAQSVAEDAQGKLWFCCFDAGVCVYDAASLVQIVPHSVHSACSSDDGGCFLGTPTNGVLYYEEQGLRVFNRDVYCSERSSVHLLRPNYLIMYVQPLGEAHLLDLTTGEEVREELLPADRIRSLVCGEDGVVWAGTSDSLCRVHDNEVSRLPWADLGITTYPKGAGLLLDSQNHLVVTSLEDRIVKVYDGREFNSIECMTNFDSQVVFICTDSDGCVWTGTKNGAIFKNAGDGVERLDLGADMPTFTIRCMMLDTAGNIWVGTSVGVLKFKGNLYQRMTASAGLRDDYITGLNALAGGDVLVSTLRGAYVYRPNQESAPSVAIAAADADVMYESPSELEVSTRVPAVTIHFGGISTKIGELKYIYYLEGHDEDWRQTWSPRVRYEALPEGEYTFHLRTVDVDLVCSSETVSMPIRVIKDPSKIQIDHLEQELDRTKGLSESIIRSIKDAIVVLDQNGKIATANQAALDLLDYREGDVVGRVITDLLSEEHRGLLDKHGLQHVLSEGLVRNRECDLLTAHGKHVPVLLSASSMNDSYGDVQGILVVATDMTAFNQLQQQLHQKQKMESLGVLAGGIAHDFNNLLGIIVGNAELIKSDLPAGSEAAECSDDVIDAALRASKLCRELLDYTGKTLVEGAKVDLSTQVKGLADLMRASISKNINLEYTLDAELPAVIAGESQVGQIVLNLITNASEAIGAEGGTVRVVTRAEHLDGAALLSTFIKDAEPAPGHYVVLEVTDDGCGMDQATQSRIFDPFFSCKFAGRGLGLATVYGIVRRLHGILKVESELGVGTKFTVCLPASESVREKQEQQSTPASASGHRCGGKVLIVDDEERVLMMGGRMLQRLGFTVVEAVDGLDAVEKFDQHQDDLSFVLMDLTMPRMDGKEAFKEIRKRNRDIPVILSSGFSEVKLNEEFDGETLPVLCKPYTCAELESALLEANVLV